MTKFADRLWDDLAREHGAALEGATRPKPGLTRHPRVLAGGTLAVAAVAAAVTVGLTSTGSTSTPTTVTTTAYSITETSSNSVLVTIDQGQALPQANKKLAELGIHEQIVISVGSGAATTSGPVTCTPEKGVTGPTVKVLLGTNGTEVISAGSGNTGVGTWHLGACVTTDSTGSGVTGNTGNG